MIGQLKRHVKTIPKLIFCIKLLNELQFENPVEAKRQEQRPRCTMSSKLQLKNHFFIMGILTKKSILDLSTTAMVPGGAIGGALGGIVRQNWTFHFSCPAWSGNCRSDKGLCLMYTLEELTAQNLIYDDTTSASSLCYKNLHRHQFSIVL